MQLSKTVYSVQDIFTMTNIWVLGGTYFSLSSELLKWASLCSYLLQLFLCLISSEFLLSLWYHSTPISHAKSPGISHCAPCGFFSAVQHSGGKLDLKFAMSATKSFVLKFKSRDFSKDQKKSFKFSIQISLFLFDLTRYVSHSMTSSFYWSHQPNHPKGISLKLLKVVP